MATSSHFLADGERFRPGMLADAHVGREGAQMKIQQYMEAPVSAGEINRLEVDVVTALMNQHAAKGYRLVDFQLQRQGTGDMVTVNLVLARG